MASIVGMAGSSSVVRMGRVVLLHRYRCEAMRRPAVLVFLDDRAFDAILGSERIRGHLDTCPRVGPAGRTLFARPLSRPPLARACIFEPARRYGDVAYAGYHVYGVEAVKRGLAEVCGCDESIVSTVFLSVERGSRTRVTEWMNGCH